MSYRQPNTGDPMRDYCLRLEDFVMLAPRLLAANTRQGFWAWFEKLYLIDQRSLRMVLRNHWLELPLEYREYALMRFNWDI